ncbi:MAG: hypothetical protein JXA33_27150, partial [Anaerolineae bacterium]|nr:hypothetical protein [Anaerolineae bacterium]
QAAIDAAAPGDEIRMAQGVYTAVTALEYALGGWTQTITQSMFINKSLTVRGGYTITDWTTAHPISYPTVINPQGRGRGGVISTPDTNIPITVTLEGVAITNGYAQGRGGGLYVEGASVVISDCYMHHNYGGSLASALYLGGETITLTRSRIENNTGADYGHGIVVEMGRLTLSGNRITNNANGLLLWSTTATLVNNVIAANDEDGLSIIGGSVQAWHTTVADNGTTGVDVVNSGQGAGHLVMTNTIIAGPGTGVKVTGNDFDPSTVQLVATLWDNVTDTHIVQGGQIAHTRDFHGDPAFVSSADYHLTAASPARNRGWPTSVKHDIDGEDRDPLPDLGADEVFDPESIRQVYLPLVVR